MIYAELAKPMLHKLHVPQCLDFTGQAEMSRVKVLV
jgi:hypothetical protein